jgi:hypothetical protein
VTIDGKIIALSDGTESSTKTYSSSGFVQAPSGVYYQSLANYSHLALLNEVPFFTD